MWPFKAKAKSHPLQCSIDGGPNPAESWADFLQSVVASALLRGNELARGTKCLAPVFDALDRARIVWARFSIACR